MDQTPYQVVDTFDKTRPSLGILLCDHFKNPDTYRVLRAEGTRDWLITFTLAGEGVYEQDGRLLSAKPGDLYILRPGVRHHYATAPGEEWEFFWAHFLPLPDWLPLLQLPEPAKGLHHLHLDYEEIRKRVAEAFQRMFMDAALDGAYGIDLALHSLKEVLLLASRQHRLRTKFGIDHRVQEVLHLISENLKEKYSIPDLARQVNLSPSRLSHLFKEQVGDSIVEMTLKLRLRQSARLLKHTDRQIQEIAYDVGFSNPFYFTEQFTRLFGMSPSAYRRGNGH